MTVYMAKCEKNKIWAFFPFHFGMKWVAPMYITYVLNDEKQIVDYMIN